MPTILNYLQPAWLLAARAVDRCNTAGLCKAVLLITAVVLGSAMNCKAKTWRGLVPLKSTRVDVERLFGPSSSTPASYYLKDINVYIQYSSCRCGQDCKTDPWNVPPDTVLVIRVEFKPNTETSPHFRVEDSSVFDTVS